MVFDTHCGDFEATFDSNGRPIPIEQPDGSLQEGWVWVEPFWAPTTSIRVCAFDAQEARISPLGTDCATEAGRRDGACGCGPDLQWCSLGSQHTKVLAAMSEEVELRVQRIIEQDLPWLELFEGSVGFMNGPMAHYFRHRTGVPGGARFTEVPVDPDAIPELDFTQEDTWVEVDLGAHHAGVLTSPAFLLRFQTGRARADRFYNEFLCQPFQPPDAGLPDVDDPSPTLDLTVRAGCKYCHALLEPAAAHWGRWTPSGGGYLDPAAFPAYDETCAQCGAGQVDCSEQCNRYYVTNEFAPELDPYRGWLQAYAFLEERHEPNVELGPELLVNQGIVDGRLPRCAAERAATWLLGRPPGAADQAWLDSLADDFVASGYRWPSLIKQIVLSDRYRSVQ